MKKRLVSFWKEHRKISIFILIVITILLSLFSTQIYLYINFLLGNNVVVKLDVSPQLLQITRGETDSLKIEASVTTNPFCSAACGLRVVNLASGEILIQENATLRPGLDLNREIKITAPENKHGTIPLRVELQCNGIKTFFCHTDGKPTTRNLLVMEEYQLSSEETQSKQNLAEDLATRTELLNSIKYNISLESAALKEINDSLETESLLIKIQETNQTYNVVLTEYQLYRNLWLNEEYNQLNAILITTPFEQQTDTITTSLIKVRDEILRYTDSVKKMENSGLILASISNTFVINKNLLTEIQLLIQEYNNATKQFNNRTSLFTKQSLTQEYDLKITTLYNKTRNQNDFDALSLAVKNRIIATILCEEVGTCIPTKQIIDLATESPANLSSACATVQKLKTSATMITPGLQQDATLQNYPNTAEFIQTIETLSNNYRQKQINNMISEIPLKSPNTTLLQRLLQEHNLVKTKEFQIYDLKPAIMLKILENIPEACDLTKPEMIVLPLTVKTVTTLNVTSPTEPAISFPEPPAQCCIDKICQPCCTEKSCRENASFYPVIFIHGHAFNKDASFEYSLDAFNGIQQKLELDGYLNAGAVSLYTKKDLPLGEFGLFNVPLSMKASYYVDLFQTPENYITVQTKSENIDVYALRLKEILDTVKYQTGRPKVIIVAHSMGGLVTRRYMQIFGSENVAKLITIGTPHQGIQGSVASYCDIIGEQRECNDMNADSVFMNKLTNGELPSIPIVTIIGVGCDMDGEQGDGIVTESRAQLTGAKKYVITGTCNTFTPLHTEMLDINSFPEVYSAIKTEVASIK
ncbi:MAG: alpha/beta hydrolase [archaeon]|nr:alpha/beta hydrolase [archaeon]